MWYITELHSDSTHVQNTHAVSYIFMTHYVIRAPGMWLAHSRCWPVVFLLSTDPSVLPSPSSLQLKNTKTQTFFTRLVWWEKLTWTKARLICESFSSYRCQCSYISPQKHSRVWLLERPRPSPATEYTLYVLSDQIYQIPKTSEFWKTFDTGSDGDLLTMDTAL